MPEAKDVLTPKKRGSRVLAFVIPLLIVLYFVIDFLLRRVQEFSPSKATGILLTALQFIVLLLALILLFVLGRNLAPALPGAQAQGRRGPLQDQAGDVLHRPVRSADPAAVPLHERPDHRATSSSGSRWTSTASWRTTRAVADGFYVTTSETDPALRRPAGEGDAGQGLAGARQARRRWRPSSEPSWPSTSWPRSRSTGARRSCSSTSTRTCRCRTTTS